MTVQIPVWVVLLVAVTVLAVWALGDRGSNRTQSPAFRPAATATFTPSATRNLAAAAAGLNKFFTKPAREWIVPVGVSRFPNAQDRPLVVQVTNPRSGTARVKIRLFSGDGSEVRTCDRTVSARRAADCSATAATPYGEWARVTSDRQVYVSAMVPVLITPEFGGAGAAYYTPFPVQAFEVR